MFGGEFTLKLTICNQLNSFLGTKSPKQMVEKFGGICLESADSTLYLKALFFFDEVSKSGISSQK